MEGQGPWGGKTNPEGFGLICSGGHLGWGLKQWPWAGRKGPVRCVEGKQHWWLITDGKERGSAM